MSTLPIGLPQPVDPRDRLELLCDPGTLRALRSTVRPRRPTSRPSPGDGVIGATGEVNGRPVFCYAQDGRVSGGSLGEAHADTVVRVLRLAGQSRVPVVGIIESAGARIQEGVAALAGYGRIFHEHVRLSGVVPQLSVVVGPSAGGGAYAPALTDLVVMTDEARMFLTGPRVVREVLGEDLDAEALGGPRVHERNGVCDLFAVDDAAAAAVTRRVLGHLPSQAGEDPPRYPSTAAQTQLMPLVPSDPRKVYDIRSVIDAVVDTGSSLELAGRWARNLVTVLARVDGRPVGVIANQPRVLGGVLDAQAAQKGARFVRFCNTFGLPLLVLVDTPGFLPGSQQEAAGVIRHGAGLLDAFASCRVPRVTIILRKAFGGAYIAMNSRDLGASLTLAWPDAQIGIMGAEQAVGVLHRRELQTAAPERRGQLALAYASEHLAAAGAAADGFVDEIVAPQDTRAWVMTAIGTLKTADRRRHR